MLDPLFEFIGTHVSDITGRMWSWFSSLSLEEWTIVLAVCCLTGFLIIRGLGTKSRI